MCFGSKKEKLTIEVLGEMIKKNIAGDSNVEQFDFSSEALILKKKNIIDQKMLQRIEKTRSGYIYSQIITGKEPFLYKTKTLLEFVEMFPIKPETKKSLKKIYR